jgi:hypothetical protein
MADIVETNHAMNDDYYFDGNFPNAKLHPYDNYKNMSTLNTYRSRVLSYINTKH